MSDTATDWRARIEAAADRLRARVPGFVRETPLWKLPASAIGVDVGFDWQTASISQAVSGLL